MVELGAGAAALAQGFLDDFFDPLKEAAAERPLFRWAALAFPFIGLFALIEAESWPGRLISLVLTVGHAYVAWRLFQERPS